jgi:hypothetical protein
MVIVSDIGIFSSGPPARKEQTVSELEELRARVRTFLAAELASGGFTPCCDSWLIGFDPDFSRRLGAAQLIGVMLPTEFGGLGGGAGHRLVVSEELLSAGAPVAAHWFAERQFAPSVLRHGTVAQQREWVPKVIRGEVCMAIGLSEPDAGSDLASVRTKAEQVDGGWLISGTKVWTSSAHHADAMVVLARTSGQRHVGLSQFIVRLPQQNIDIRPIRLISGEHHFNQVIFDETFVPQSDVLGEIGNGWSQAMHELAAERAGPERYLSTFPLIEELVRDLPRDSHSAGDIGRIIADITTFRTINHKVVELLISGDTSASEIAILKAMGTAFEQETVGIALNIAHEPGNPTALSPTAMTLLREAQYQAPGFTIRGGTNEVLRGIVSKGLSK